MSAYSEFDERVASVMKANFHMLTLSADKSGKTHDENVFKLPDPEGKTGGVCTSALLQAMYEHGDLLSWTDLLKKMKTVLKGMGIDQTPQLTTNRVFDFNEKMHVVPPGSGRRRALLIGINYVGEENELSSCHNDVNTLREFLVEVYGFYEEEVLMLMDDGAHILPTKRNIEDALIRLTKYSQPGDVAFVAFCGHGGRVVDENGAYDETLIPCDYKDEGDMVDDDILKILVKPMKHDVTATVLIDCCHSVTVLDLPYRLGADDTKFHRQEGFDMDVVEDKLKRPADRFKEWRKKQRELEAEEERRKKEAEEADRRQKLEKMKSMISFRGNSMRSLGSRTSSIRSLISRNKDVQGEAEDKEKQKKVAEPNQIEYVTSFNRKPPPPRKGERAARRASNEAGNSQHGNSQPVANPNNDFAGPPQAIGGDNTYQLAPYNYDQPGSNGAAPAYNYGHDENRLDPDQYYQSPPQLQSDPYYQSHPQLQSDPYYASPPEQQLGPYYQQPPQQQYDQYYQQPPQQQPDQYYQQPPQQQPDQYYQRPPPQQQSGQNSKQESHKNPQSSPRRDYGDKRERKMSRRKSTGDTGKKKKKGEKGEKEDLTNCGPLTTDDGVPVLPIRMAKPKDKNAPPPPPPPPPPPGKCSIM